MESEIRKYFRESLDFKTSFCNTNLPSIMAQITLFTAARTLQGNEVREKLDLTVAGLYHDLDDGFQPINFMLPWFPSPKNRRRDEANRKMTQIYADIIQSRRSRQKDSEDMLWTLMSSTYKDGKQVPDNEIAHLMIALLMAGQHSTSVTSSWIMLNLAARPEVQDALYEEQLQVFGPDLGSMPLTYDGLQSLPLLINVIRETLRLHSPIHSIMRKVKNPLPVPDTSWVVPTSHVLLAAPSTIGKTDKYFPDARRWDPYRWESIPDPKSMERQKMDYGYGLVSTGADSTYLPFGAGRHRCIGENFANCQLAVVVSLMVRFFRITNLEGQEGVVKTDYSVSLAFESCHRRFWRLLLSGTGTHDARSCSPYSHVQWNPRWFDWRNGKMFGRICKNRTQILRVDILMMNDSEEKTLLYR